MNRLSPELFDAGELPFAPTPADPRGLVIACSAECFAPELLALQLQPGAWLVHRTPGNVVPPYGAGYEAEERLLERAVGDLRVGAVVVCGHHPCGVASHLLREGEPAGDFVLRDWLSHAESARRVLAGGEHGEREAASRNVVAQLANLRTHPAVAAALARGELSVWGWLHAGELYFPGRDPTTFDRLVALHPEQNRHLRRERGQRCRRPAPGRTGAPYLA